MSQICLFIITGDLLSQSFFNSPPPNRTCDFHRIQLSSEMHVPGFRLCGLPPLLLLHTPHLWPFPLYRALPRSLEYYGHSVTIDVSVLRRSRICRCSTSSPCRCPIHLLALLIGECPSWRVFLMPAENAQDHDGPASGMLRGAPTYAAWRLGFNQSRLHPASRACSASVYIPSTLATLLTCSVPLCLSTSGRSVALEGLTLYLLPLLWLSYTYRNGALGW